MAYQLGIDLGTTYTSAAVCRSSDRRWVEPEVVTLGTRGATIPSVLFLAPDGSVVVGDAAERRAVTDPDRVVREFKRRIGDPTPIVVAGRAWAPEELSARLVRWVVDRVAEREGGPATRVAVTHPASWGEHKKDLLGGALAAQGLSVVFLAEPQAAALHYAAAERIEPGSTIAVYDLGGGTFDAAVVRKADRGAAASGAAGFGLLGRPEGLERLGGVDFDEAVFEHVKAGLPDVFAGLDAADPAVLAAVVRVRRDCTEAKEALSADTEVSIPVLLPGSRGSARLHRSEFEAMIRPRVEETVAALRSAVASAGLTPEQLTTVLLVGGSSRIPLVAQLVSEQLGRPVAVDADPKNAIAMGAALSVSPKPTASWPGVAIPPVPGAPAPRPPRPAAGAVAAASFGQAPPRPAEPATQRYDAAPRRGGPTHEPATALLSGAQPPPPPARPRAEPEPDYDDWQYDDEPPRRRPTGLLIGVGGLLAVAALVVAVLVWSSPAALTGAGTGIGGAPSTATGTVPEVPTGVEAPPPGDTGGSGGGTGDGGTGGGAGGGAGGGTPSTTAGGTTRPPTSSGGTPTGGGGATPTTGQAPPTTDPGTGTGTGGTGTGTGEGAGGTAPTAEPVPAGNASGGTGTPSSEGGAGTGTGTGTGSGTEATPIAGPGPSDPAPTTEQAV